MRAIEGKNVNVKFRKEGEGYIPVACSTSCSINILTEIKGKTTKGSGTYKEKTAGLTDTNGSINSITHIVPMQVMYTVFDITMESIRKNGLDMEMEFDDREGNRMFFRQHVFFPSIGITAGAEGFSEDSIDWEGSGAFQLTPELIAPPENNNEVKPGDYTAFGGELVIQALPDAIGAELIGFWRDRPLDIILVGAPNDGEVKWDASTGKMYLASEARPGEYFYYQYKKL